MKNGREESRKQLSSVVTQEPVNRVEIVGTKKKSVDTTFSGDFAGALAKLRSCEGGYTSNTGNGYYGAYQFDIKTWGGFGGYANAAEAPPEVQDQKAWERTSVVAGNPGQHVRIRWGCKTSTASSLAKRTR